MHLSQPWPRNLWPTSHRLLLGHISHPPYIFAASFSTQHISEPIPVSTAFQTLYGTNTIAERAVPRAQLLGIHAVHPLSSCCCLPRECFRAEPRLDPFTQECFCFPSLQQWGCADPMSAQTQDCRVGAAHPSEEPGAGASPSHGAQPRWGQKKSDEENLAQTCQPQDLPGKQKCEIEQTSRCAAEAMHGPDGRCTGHSYLPPKTMALGPDVAPGTFNLRAVRVRKVWLAPDGHGPTQSPPPPCLETPWG
ncbi:uncharacterized protein LOC117098322 [Trachypithecus francoisi]|uniref:uncharacterized protein LOC117098322 n=1 Tax=Trachypithecus francoisi TaxID=54180 RepID=UPI00141B2764|nr:uncharacterized protein LOC117098322 [Trachypithecus francoisi]